MIKIINLHKAFDIDEGFLRKVIRDLSLRLRFKEERFEFVFLDRRRIRKLNRDFKKIDRPTDVLAFLLEAIEGDSRHTYANIFISLDAALENSRIFGTSFQEETVLYIIHGMLHIAGYDDRGKAERSRMRRREEELLRKTCANRDLSRALTRA